MATIKKWSTELKDTGYIAKEHLQAKLAELFEPDGHTPEDFKIAVRARPFSAPHSISPKTLLADQKASGTQTWRYNNEIEKVRGRKIQKRRLRILGCPSVVWLTRRELDFLVYNTSHKPVAFHDIRSSVSKELEHASGAKTTPHTEGLLKQS
jgi:hypothetical protein